MKKIFLLLFIVSGLYSTFRSNAQIDFVGDGRTHVILKMEVNGNTYSFRGNHIYEKYANKVRIGKETVENGRHLRDHVYLQLGEASKTKREGYRRIYYYEPGTYKIYGTATVAGKPYANLKRGSGEIEITNVKGNTTISGRFYLKDDYGVTCEGIIENVKMPEN